jgi:alcohol dehydrogenase (quinone), cytochrome c subunit
MTARAWLSAAAVMALALPFNACGEDPRQERVALGKEVYTRECSRCHLIGGQGYPRVYPNLDRNPIVELETPEAVTDIVLNGRESMPAFEGELPEQKIAAVITYIRQAWHNHASGVTPAQVK